MKAEELMIGDWVYWKGKPVQIAQISGIKYSFGHIDVVLAHCNDNNILETHDIKSIKPIPINPEFLELNGFKKSGSYYIDECADEDGNSVIKDYEIIYWDDKHCSIQNLITEDEIEFYCPSVHQLQQAMRLCEITKEITLN